MIELNMPASILILLSSRKRISSILKYLKNGLMEKRSGSYALTTKGMFVSNYILSDILEFEDLGSVSRELV